MCVLLGSMWQVPTCDYQACLLEFAAYAMRYWINVALERLCG